MNRHLAVHFGHVEFASAGDQLFERFGGNSTGL